MSAGLRRGGSDGARDSKRDAARDSTLGAIPLDRINVASQHGASAASQHSITAPQQRLGPSPQPARPGMHRLLVLVIGALTGVALLHVYVHLRVIALSYDLGRERKLRHDLGESSEKLRLELAVRKDPSVIERRAREELHMTPPDPRLLRTVHAPAQARSGGSGLAATTGAGAGLGALHEGDPAAMQQGAGAAMQQGSGAATQQGGDLASGSGSAAAIAGSTGASSGSIGSLGLGWLSATASSLLASHNQLVMNAPGSR